MAMYSTGDRRVKRSKVCSKAEAKEQAVIALARKAFPEFNDLTDAQIKASLLSAHDICSPTR
jgi:hypothetical protein